MTTQLETSHWWIATWVYGAIPLIWCECGCGCGCVCVCVCLV